MKITYLIALLSVAFFEGICTPHAVADNFGTGANVFDIEFIPIGEPGNAADIHGYLDPAGSVPYSYRLGKFEIAKHMIDTANTLGELGITHVSESALKPATGLTWYEAALFVNWLNTSTGHVPAYYFDVNANFESWVPGDRGYDPANPHRNKLSKYFLPTTDEWHKAAYYDPTQKIYYDYPTGSNTPPIPAASGTLVGTAIYGPAASEPADTILAGGLSPFGTMGQAGNVWEWTETVVFMPEYPNLSLRGSRGGSRVNLVASSSSTFRSAAPADWSSSHLGLRVASRAIPEPHPLILAAFASIGFLLTLRQ